ncbi:MAG: MlaD family protein [Bacteroidota bacterium]|jgi:phospholipid/cholesterol/gamma-HCH transport system substrate-binding protein|nr:MlaD family protein [Bacteroidota bacterium]
MKKTNFSRARVGFLIFIGVLAFSVGIFFIGEKSQFFSSAFYIRVNFENVEGVKPGATVMLSGYNVGTVYDIALTPKADSIRLLLRIDDDVRAFIKMDTKAEIKQEGLVGNKFISLSIGSPTSPEISNNAYIEGVPPFALGSVTDNLVAIADTAKLVTGELNLLLHRINTGNGTIGKLFTDDQLYTRLVSITEQTEIGLRRTNEQLEQLASLLSKSITTLDVIALKADTAMDHTVRITDHAASIVRKVDDGEGTLGLLMNDRALYDSLRMFLAALTDVTYDAGNAADQTARALHAMREHWLFGRVFAGEEFENEAPVQSSYVRRMRELQRRLQDIERREAELGLTPGGAGVKPGSTPPKPGAGGQQGR